MESKSVGVGDHLQAGDAVSAAVDLRCWLCGGHGDLETAATKYGPEYVCADGYACAQRANGQRAGKARFAVVAELSAETEPGRCDLGDEA